MKAIALMMFSLAATSLCFAQAPAEKQKKAFPADGAPVEKAEQEAQKPRKQLAELKDAARIGDSKKKIPISRYDSTVVGLDPSLKELVDTSTRRIRDIPERWVPTR